LGSPASALLINAKIRCNRTRALSKHHLLSRVFNCHNFFPFVASLIHTRNEVVAESNRHNLHSVRLHPTEMLSINTELAGDICANQEISLGLRGVNRICHLSTLCVNNSTDHNANEECGKQSSLYSIHLGGLSLWYRTESCSWQSAAVNDQRWVLCRFSGSHRESLFRPCDIQPFPLLPAPVSG
jgi:hypothetical protein